MKKAVVVIILTEENKVLLLKRTAEHSLFPNQWCLPGGKIDYLNEIIEGKTNYRWEDPEETIYRETVEETGIKLTVYAKAKHILHDNNFLVYVFGSATTSNSKNVTVKFPNREHSEFRFFDKDELNDMSSNELGDLTKNAIKAIVNQ